MTTAFSQVVGAVIAALEAAPAVCPSVFRARANAVPESLEQAISVQWDQATPHPATIAGAPKDWQTRITVECYARGVRDSGDVVVDPLLEAVFARLAEDTTLGGLIDDLNIVGLEAENSAEGKKTGWVRLTYIAEHRTTNTSLS